MREDVFASNPEISNDETVLPPPTKLPEGQLQAISYNLHSDIILPPGHKIIAINPGTSHQHVPLASLQMQPVATTNVTQPQGIIYQDATSNQPAHLHIPPASLHLPDQNLSEPTASKPPPAIEPPVINQEAEFNKQPASKRKRKTGEERKEDRKKKTKRGDEVPDDFYRKTEKYVLNLNTLKKESAVLNRTCLLCDTITRLKSVNNLKAHFLFGNCQKINEQFRDAVKMGNLRYCCKMCQEIFTCNEQKSLHFAFKHDKEIIECSICKKNIIFKDLKQHKISHIENMEQNEDLSCSACDFIGTTATFLAHMMNTHKLLFKNINRHNIEYYCDKKNHRLSVLLLMRAKERLR